MVAILEKSTKARKSAEQRKHDYYLTLATLLREGRLHRMPMGVKRASFEINGEHVDMYASSTYAGYGYVVRFGEQGYECGCEQFEHRHNGCKHTQDANARAKARYERLSQLHEAAVIAPAILGEFAQDLPAHIDDDLSVQDDPIERERAAWYAMTAEQRRVVYSETFDLSYGDAA